VFFLICIRRVKIQAPPESTFPCVFCRPKHNPAERKARLRMVPTARRDLAKLWCMTCTTFFIARSTKPSRNAGSRPKYAQKCFITTETLSWCHQIFPWDRLILMRLVRRPSSAVYCPSSPSSPSSPSPPSSPSSPSSRASVSPPC